MKYLLTGLTALMISVPAMAQQNQPAAPPANNSAPIEITATKTVEWLRNDNKYVARENVVVTQGAMTINTDLLTADYREGAQSSTEIYKLTAEGNVVIKDDTNTAYGDLGVYDVPEGVAILTGENLKLVSPDQTVTATERMEYHANTREAKAIGNAKVVRAKDTLSADTITAFFKDKNAAPATSPKQTDSPLGGGGNLDRLEAQGHVVIKTPTETLYGDKAIYRADTNTAELLGKVRVLREQNTLEGNRAEVNLTTNVSKMYSSGKDGGRVRGVFFPGSDSGLNKPEPDKKPAAAPAPVAAPAPAPVAPPAPANPAPGVSTQAPDLFPAENTMPTARQGGMVSPQVKY